MNKIPSKENSTTPHNRRAEINAFVVIIVFGLVLIVMIILVKQYLLQATGEKNMRVCQSSLLLSIATGKVTVSCAQETPTPFELTCSRSFITVSGDKVMKDNHDATNKYTPACPDGTNACLAKNVAAQEMAYCWKTFFEGQKPVLQQADIAAKNIFTWKDYKRACFICSEITFNEQNSDMVGYLKTQQISKKDQRTFYNYFANSSGAWCDTAYDEKKMTCWDGVASGIKVTIGGTHPSIDYSSIQAKKYAVVFMRQGLGSCDTTPEDKTLAQHQHLTNTVQLVPAEQVNQVCDVVIA